ncbi:MAG: hypothetical protein SV760_05705 [Halobacteria archaeon]|nr:hypothetical protein [Halobacteria archaeon]
MTKDAVRNELDDYVHQVARRSLDEVNPLNVLDANTSLSGGAIKEAMRGDIRQEMIGIKSSFQNQCRLMVESAADDAADDYFEEFLESDVFYQNYQGDDESAERFKEDLGEYFDDISQGMKPVVESDEDEFWDAFVDVYEKEEALEVLHRLFNRSEIVQKYADGMVMMMDLDTGLPIEEIEYTQESLRVFEVAEKYLRDMIEEEAEKAYGD